MLGALEAGGTKCIVAIADEDFNILKRERIDTRTPAESLPEILDFFHQSPEPLTGLGIASFGPLCIDQDDPEYGNILVSPKIPWRGFSFLNEFAPLGVPMLVDTDVNGAAIGEAVYGAAKGARTVAYITVGTGIGVGMVKDSDPLYGFSHYEIGHIMTPRMDGDTFEGICPSHTDCAEGLACGPAIKARWGTSLSELPQDHPAHEIEAFYLAHLISSIVLMHTPHRIILGGGVMKTPGLIERVRTKAVELLGDFVTSEWLDEGLESYIQLPGLGDNSGIVGALTLAQKASVKG